MHGRFASSFGLLVGIIMLTAGSSRLMGNPPALPAPKAIVTMNAIQAAHIANNGAISLSGTYGVNPGYTPDSVWVYVMTNGATGNVVTMKEATLNLGQWSVTTPALPAGDYVVIAMFNAVAVNPPDKNQTVSDRHQLVTVPANNTPALPATVSTLGWANGKPARTAANQMSGEGPYSVAGATYQKGSFYSLPVPGGVVDYGATNLTGPPGMPKDKWDALGTHALPAAPKCDVVAILEFVLAGGGGVVRYESTEVKFNK